MSSKNISAEELKQISKICERVHYTQSNEPFSNHLYVVMNDLLPSIHFMNIHFSLSPLGVKEVINSTLPGLQEFMRFMHQHPGIQRYCCSGQKVGSLLTELQPKAYRKTELYNEVYRPVNIEDQVWIGIGDRSEVMAISYSRDKAYTSQDLQRLSMILPHANVAWKNWKRIRELEQQLRDLQESHVKTEQQAQHMATMQAAIQSLTNRQREVVELVSVGKTNLEIAEGLRISPRTVAKHLEQVFKIVGAHTRTELALNYRTYDE